VEDRCVPGHIIRDARDALTTAGYKMHEARAAVERALTQLDDQVTLPQLIRQALRCCAIAHR
jgi:Holliday junction resolvasome RuvABC DNA-binding subunit